MVARLLAGAGGIALALALAWMHGNARYNAGKLGERAAWQTVVAAKEREIADLRVADERRVTAATEAYAERLAAIQPVIVRSTDTVTKYANTPSGAALCLAASRVSGIDADAAALGLRPATAPARGDGAMQPITDPP